MTTSEDARNQLAERWGLKRYVIDAVLSDVSLLMQALGATLEQTSTWRLRRGDPLQERWHTPWVTVATSDEIMAAIRRTGRR